ncbi:hypothetical protein A6R68_07418, partial [Neotoma lepida]
MGKHKKERIRSLTKEYIEKSKRTEALKDLTLDIYKGQITAILGHSGAGKSTLLNILSGLCVPNKVSENSFIGSLLQIFLLDEPTAGLDPFSRHRVWNLLKERKADRVVLFSTQFMDEADILADRKVFISKGKLKCVGSSLFLKKKWGIGYHL